MSKQNTEITWEDILSEYHKCFPPFSAPYPDFLTWVQENYYAPKNKPSMKTFINSSKTPKIDKTKVEEFIEIFNKDIQKAINDGKSLEYLTKNTGLTNVPRLNRYEFSSAYTLAQNEGWILSDMPDEHGSITYKLTKR